MSQSEPFVFDGVYGGLAGRLFFALEILLPKPCFLRKSAGIYEKWYAYFLALLIHLELIPLSCKTSHPTGENYPIKVSLSIFLKIHITMHLKSSKHVPSISKSQANKTMDWQLNEGRDL